MSATLKANNNSNNTNDFKKNSNDNTHNDLNNVNSTSLEKEENAIFPNDIVLSASGGFDLPNPEDDADGDDVSISDESVISSITNSTNIIIDNNDNNTNIDAMTIDTETVDTHDIKHNLSNNTNNSSLDNLNESEEEDKFIDNLLSFDKSLEDDGPSKNDINSYDRESKEVRGRPSACVFVASLSSNLSDDVLCESVTNHFKQWGEMTLIKVLRDPANRPYAFVQYARDEDADLAISEGQHSILNGRTVRCEKARVNRTLYLQLSNFGISEKTINKLLNRFGEIERLVVVNENFNVIKSTNPKLTYKNWFCKFVYRQDAISAFASLKTKPNWNIEWAQNLEDEYSNVPEVTIDKYSVFVGHLDPRISKDDLVERFEVHGKIKEAILVNRPLSNFAFIKFKTKESAASAVERENHAMFKYKTIHVQYREMYNNYRRKFSTENGLKLNLAPPPVNFKRKGNFNSNRKLSNCQKNQQQPYHIKNNSFFENNNEDLVPKTFSQFLKIKHSSKNRGKLNFNFKNSRYSNIHNNNNSNNNLLTKKYPYNHEYTNQMDLQHVNKLNVDISNPTNNIIGEDDNGINDRKFDVNTETNNELLAFEETESKVENKSITDNDNYMEVDEDKSIDHSINDNDIDIMRSNQTFSSAGPKTGYTYSSVDNGEHEMINMYHNQAVNPAHYQQYPYYYYYPTKDMQYFSRQVHPMMNNEHPANSSNRGPMSGTGYYYPYQNNYPPNTPNGPGMYPMYMYYNPVPIMDHHEGQAQPSAFRSGEHGNSPQGS